ncbi:coat protein [ssRNA phage AIN000]|uniref:Coat protein n=1 Tax=ssRNA phage AIN000 TaxID=2785983 RepID=A0A8S5KXM3_9VIRU|nr:coat protein [ssRNA phage AIN000]DAD49839.1 TPA_asm: coat protein [ssRNA phage AIN000]
MAQAVQVSLADRETTPVTHVFNPGGTKDGVSRFVNNVSGVPVGFEVLTVSSRETSGKHKIRLVLSLPVVQSQVISGITTPVVVRTAFAEVNFTFASTSSLQERKNAVGMISAALASSQTMLNDTLTNLTPVW